MVEVVGEYICSHTHPIMIGPLLVVFVVSAAPHPSNFWTAPIYSSHYYITMLGVENEDLTDSNNEDLIPTNGAGVFVFLSLIYTSC